MNNLESIARAPSDLSSKRKLSLWTRTMVLAQVSSVFIAQPLLRFAGDYTVKGSVDFSDHNDSYLIIANHQSRWDAFAIFSVLPVSQRWKASPVKFLTAKGIYNTPLRPILKLLGCYPTRNRIATVNESVYLLNSGYSVCIFPEGRRTLEVESNPREGVIEMMRTVHPNTKLRLVLVHLEWRRRGFFNRHLTVTFKEEADAEQFQNASQLMKTIYSL